VKWCRPNKTFVKTRNESPENAKKGRGLTSKDLREKSQYGAQVKEGREKVGTRLFYKMVNNGSHPDPHVG